MPINPKRIVNNPDITKYVTAINTPDAAVILYVYSANKNLKSSVEPT